MAISWGKKGVKGVMRRLSRPPRVEWMGGWMGGEERAQDHELMNSWIFAMYWALLVPFTLSPVPAGLKYMLCA
jgi:hypothetical protein